MRYFILVILCFAIGVGATLFADRSPGLRPQIDRTLAAVTPSEVSASGRDGVVPRAELMRRSMLTCFERDDAYSLSPPSWMTRRPLGTLAGSMEAVRPYPDLADHPGLVKLEQIQSTSGLKRRHCAATRIAEHWFLTANHCVRMRGVGDRALDMIIVAPAEDVMDQDAVIVPVTGAICHAAWFSDTGKFDDDIALIYVEDPSPLSDIDIAVLDAGAAPYPPQAYDAAYFAGWGKNGDNRFLQGGPVRVSRIGEAFILAEAKNEFGPCVGDSGGPLYIERDGGPRVVGVLSSVTTDACPPYDRAFYMRVKSFENWIRNVMELCRQNGRFVCGRE